MPSYLPEFGFLSFMSLQARPVSLLLLLASCLLLTFPTSSAAAPSFIQNAGASTLPPAIAVIDLASADGARQLGAQWRYHDARLIPAKFFNAAADGQPGLRTSKTARLEPQAGARDYDDHGWAAIPAESLSRRRSAGLNSFNWYRVRLTIPEQVSGVSTRGLTAVLDTTLDDYAEIWVDGELPRAPGQTGGSVIAGWNAPNRLVVGRDLQPGQQIQLAIFGMNGPVSAVPTNYIYLHDVRLSFHDSNRVLPYATGPQEVNVEVIRRSRGIDRVVPRNPKLWKLAEGFRFTEGPVFVDAQDGGHLLFSDPNANRIYRYSDADGLSVFRELSGYEAQDIGEYRQPGSNGLTLDAEGRLTIDQHGNRRVVRLERDGHLTVLADRDGTRRLNSPNDLVYKSDGALYFTDPPFGLPRVYDDPLKELPYSGVYRVKDGDVRLLTSELTGPNGLAFSPDERFLYVGNWDAHRKRVMRYPVKMDGSLGRGTVFADLTSSQGEDAIDGMKVDVEGNLYISGPGGLWVYSPTGKALGTVVLPRHPHNMAFGDADGRSLYLCAEDRLYRMRLNIAGIRPMPRTSEGLP